MPRYFFHLPDDRFPLDTEGTDLRSPEQARAAAAALAGEMLRDLNGPFWDKPLCRVQVTDEQGRTVFRLSITGETGEA